MMMTFLQKASWLLSAGLLIWVGCQGNSSKPISSAETQKLSSFVLNDSTRLVLPFSFRQTDFLGSDSQLTAQVFSSFYNGIDPAPSKVYFFSDSLAGKYVVAYQVDYQSFDQNMAALINTDLTQQFNMIGDQLQSVSTKKIESMQYASTEWHALKFKFELAPNIENAGSKPQVHFATVFYYNGKERAYYFLEYGRGEADLDFYLRKLRFL